MFRSREGHTGELVRPKLPTFRARSYGKDTSLTSSYLRYGLRYECLQVLRTGQRTHPDRLKVKSRVQVGLSVIRPEYIGVANHNLQGVVAQ